MAWVRDVSDLDELKISFIVRKKDNPALFNWLLSLPFRGTSKIIRDILDAAVKAATKDGVVAQSPSPAPAAPVQQSEASSVEHIAPAESAVTEEVADIIRTFGSSFSGTTKG